MTPLLFPFTTPLFVAIICWLAYVWCKLDRLESKMNKEVKRYVQIVDKFKLEK